MSRRLRSRGEPPRETVSFWFCGRSGSAGDQR